MWYNHKLLLSNFNTFKQSININMHYFTKKFPCYPLPYKWFISFLIILCAHHEMFSKKVHQNHGRLKWFLRSNLTYLKIIINILYTNDRLVSLWVIVLKKNSKNLNFLWKIAKKKCVGTSIIFYLDNLSFIFYIT